MLRWLRRKPAKLLVIGLDCAAPELVFQAFRDDLPTLRQLMAAGTWGTLKSTIPCITVPAWSSMFSSMDPGTLGIYGFRNRVTYDDTEMAIADGTAVREKRVWDYLSATGLQSVVLNVPQTYPTRPLEGHMVSGFLTPGTGSAFTYPAIFKQEVLRVAPNYTFDVRGFRTEDKAWLAQQISDMTEVQFNLLKHTLTTKDWDFAVYVNIGTDRVHHGFWRYHDPTHRLYEVGNSFEQTIRDYYKQVDAHIGDVLDTVDDDVIVMIVSDHGVRRMDGGICINEWLWRNGWLALKQPPPDGQITRFEDVEVDWQNTRAWGSGGYYGRVFLNVEGREPQGCVPQAAYQETRDELAAALRAIPDPDGNPLQTVAYEPEDIYQSIRNVPPDLLVYFGDLHWRSVGSLGHGGVHTLENDTGPDDANHSPDGIFMIYEPRRSGRGEIVSHQLMDVAPTILNRLRQPVPDVMQGKVIET